ncbi:hypothetical protein NNRS527_00196 [Nitrosospira sp. NRS527]|nr:hypothetical protein NNRS527_00196 [Nitrosospira sp. NRS527]
MWHIAACGKLSQTNTGAAIAKIAGNYARGRYIGWFTFFPGFDVSPTPIDMTRLNKLFDGKTHQQHLTPVVYKSPVRRWMVCCWEENRVCAPGR